MDKQKVKRVLFVALMIFVGLALTVTYFMILFKGQSVLAWLGDLVVIMRPVLIGAVIAYVLKSTCNLYQKYILKIFKLPNRMGERRAETVSNIVSVVLTYITWGIAVSGLITILIFAIPKSIENMQQIPALVISHYNALMAWIGEFKQRHQELAPYIDNVVTFVQNWVSTEIFSKIPEIGGSILLKAIDIVTIIKDSAIGIIVSVLLLVGRKSLARKFNLFTRTVFKKDHADFIIEETRYADRMFSGFLEGKIIDSTLIGIIYFIFLSILDVDFAALIALICGITNVIPFFGPFIGAIPSGVIILFSHMDDPFKLIAFIIFVFIIQFIDGNIIEPHIVGGNIKLSPFSVIFAVTLFGGLWGIPGLILGVPIYAVLYDVLKKILRSRIKQKEDEAMLQEFKDEYDPKEPQKRVKKRKKNAPDVEAVATDVNEPAEAEEESTCDNSSETNGPESV